MTWGDGTTTSRTAPAFESSLRAYADSKAQGYVAGVDFDIKPTNSAADNDAGFAAAIAACEANRRLLWLPGGVYPISSPVDMRFDHAMLQSEGATLFQRESNVAGLQVGGKYCCHLNILVGYETVQTAAETNANAIEVFNLWGSYLDGIVAYNCGRAWYCPEDEGSNYCFSNVIGTFKVYRPSISAINLKPTDTGNTGNLFLNVHIDADLGGGSVGTLSEPAIYIESSSQQRFERLNVEWLRCTNAAGLGMGVIKARDSSLDIASLSYEGVESVVDGGAWLEAVGPVGGSSIRIGRWGMSDGHADDVAVFNFGVVKLNDANSNVRIGRLAHSSMGTAGTYYTFLNGAYATGQVARLTDGPLPTVDDRINMTGTAPQIPVLRQYGDRWYAWQAADKWVLTGTAAPTTGTWAVGDRVINTAPSSGGASEWRCTTAGTPGTWRALTLDAS